MKYFYIITFDQQIFEIQYTEEKLKSAMLAWKNGDLLLLKEIGGGIHASSIAKILNEDLYDSYTYTSKPKLFIKNGTWYDGKERNVVRREKWRQEELDKQVEIPSLPINQHISEEKRKYIKELLSKYRPQAYI